MKDLDGSVNRREFLRRTGLAGAAAVAAPGAVAITVDPADAVAATAPARWAVEELRSALSAAGWTVRSRQGGELQIVVTSRGAEGPEGVALKRNGSTIVAAGADARGLVYAVLELADRVRMGAPLQFDRTITERPANPVRSVMRQFTSETLDKPWFYDREMWPRYLTMLAGARFNRFHLTFGLGYDDLKNVADSYFLFTYPFLLAVPGHNVRATNLSDAERDRNLETLRYISEQTVARGMDFQLGLWMHGYNWPTSPRAQNRMEGLTAENHAAYCRDALTAVLRACPAVSSVSLRIHGESGIAEGSYDFWKTVFDGVARCGRKVEIDLHAKGIDATMIDNALATGMPVNIAPKYWAEHMGMPYHQAAIRQNEVPVPGRSGAGLMTLSEGSRSTTRYGYADLLRDDRRYTVRHRVFSGTQRLLLWGDPAWAGAYSRAFGFCGSTGVDLMEPLTCRGRRGTGTGSRSGYADRSLESRWDWERYAYWYRVWGRKLYNPDCDAEVCGRAFPGAASAWASGLARASRILPIVTTAYLPSAACDAYWPEIYWNQPLTVEPGYNPYTDTEAPKVFQNASPLDPRMFSRMSEFAGELLKGERSGKYTPVEVAQWIDDLADGAARDAARAGVAKGAELRRVEVDVAMLAGLGRFFAARFRSGVLYALYEQTEDRRALDAALKGYKTARTAWTQVMARARGVYAPDLSASDRDSERGQWSDRLAAIDQDIARAEARLASAKESNHPRLAQAIAEVLGRPRRQTPPCTHRQPAGYRAQEPVELQVAIGAVAAARLYYRHVNQAEDYQSLEMERQGGGYRARIPATYTDSPYPLQYYFEFRESPEKAWIYPGFEAGLSNSPYFVLRRS